MNRRRFIASAVAVASGLTGCSSRDSGNSNNDTPDVDTGTIYDGILRELRSWEIEVVDSQSAAVQANDISEGERLHFQVGDGTSFVHSYSFYEEDSGTMNRYKFESDGQYQLQLNAERHESPMDKDVEIDVSLVISAP